MWVRFVISHPVLNRGRSKSTKQIKNQTKLISNGFKLTGKCIPTVRCKTGKSLLLLIRTKILIKATVSCLRMRKSPRRLWIFRKKALHLRKEALSITCSLIRSCCKWRNRDCWKIHRCRILYWIRRAAAPKRFWISLPKVIGLFNIPFFTISIYTSEQPSRSNAFSKATSKESNLVDHFKHSDTRLSLSNVRWDDCWKEPEWSTRSIWSFWKSNRER